MTKPIDTAALLAFVQAARENLDRIEGMLNPEPKSGEEDLLARLDPGSPLNKSDQWLSLRGIEVCYQLFEAGKSKYEVAKSMKVTFGAADHRYRTWVKLGGKDRKDRHPELI